MGTLVSMHPELSSLYRLKRKDAKKAAAVFSRAFQNDLLAQVMFPDEDFRRKILPTYFTYRITYGILYGEVYAPSPTIEGLAVWYLSDQYEMTNWRNMRAGGMKLMFNTDKETLKRMNIIGHFTTELRNKYTSEKYWYLAPIGVDPSFQGKGFASKLMRAMLARIDSENLSALLETQDERNVKIYNKFGFEIVQEVTLPNTDVPHWLMSRLASD